MTFGSGNYTYTVQENWWTLPAGWAFGWIPGVACDSQDRVYVYSRSEHPLIRFDRFDCVTFVEEVMALSWTPHITATMPLLQQIRYTAGHIAYGKRKHIMMAQWIPQNIKAGFVRDITRAIGKTAARSATLVIAHADFATKQGKALKLSRSERPVGTHRLDIVPAAQMHSLVQTVPHGTIISTIRVAKKGVPYRASHVGLVLVDSHDRRIVRHADGARRRVVEEPLATFIQRSSRYRSWRVAGFSLLAINPKLPSKTAAVVQSH